MTLDVYRGRKTKHKNNNNNWLSAASQAGANRLSPVCEAGDNRLQAATSLF